MAAAQLSSSLSVSIAARVPSIAGNGIPPFSNSCSLPLPSSFVSGSPLRLHSNSHSNSHLIHGTRHLKTSRKALSIRSEQSSKGGGGSSFDVWLGRIAMIGFTVAITIEVSTGKGLLENFGLTSPLPTVALAVTALVVALTAYFITQSGSDN